MTERRSVLLVGGTGRTGGRVLRQLLARGIPVRAIVRSAARLPSGVTGHALLTVVEADVLSLAEAELQRQVRGVGAIVSCLGHTISVKGVFGPPRDLVTRALARLCRAVEAVRPAEPIKVVLMSSVSVSRPRGLDPRRGPLERAFLWALCRLVPAANDNQRAADFLTQTIDPGHAFIEWVAVRPDTLVDGDVSEYTVHEAITHGLLSPGHTSMANVAHLMCELVTNPEIWAAWRFKLPVITDGGARSD